MRILPLPLLLLPIATTLAQDRTFVSKRAVELPIERALDVATPVYPVYTAYSKGLVELPIERVLDLSTLISIAPEGPIAPPRAKGPVAPGLVRWHADFASACAAAQRSGKPVLLFQLLGQLDQEFC